MQLFRQKYQPENPLFPPQTLRRLLVPLIIEQVLAVMIGMADTIMVSNVGEAAISGVSLVDSINFLLINILTALATGGAVVAAQYIGRQDHESACNAARQLVVICVGGSFFITLFSIIFRVPLLALLFGQVEADVMRNAQTYFLLSALSYPFIGLYNAGAALFRAMGNSRISMNTSIVMNVINVILNAVFIFGCRWGVFGAALATLISRVIGSLYVILLLRDAHNPVNIRGMRHFRFHGGLIRSILRIGVPNGLENGVFQIGKVLVQSVIAGFGTASIAANAIAGNLSSLSIIPASAVGLAMITVIGQCVGAGDKLQARYYTKKLMFYSYVSYFTIGMILVLLMTPIISLYSQSAEASTIARELYLMHLAIGVFLWPAAFTLPNALRAAGDARFTMVVSITCMWLCRILLSYVFGIWLGMGVHGVWLAMCTDWIFRAGAYILRFRGSRWLEIKTID